MVGGVYGADGICFDRADGLLGMVGVEFVCGVATDEVEDCERAAGVCGEPGLWYAEEKVVVDDEGVAGEDTGSDLFARPEPVHETHNIGRGQKWSFRVGPYK